MKLFGDTPEASVRLSQDAPGVLRVTLHQPALRNAIAAGMWRGLGQALEALRSRHDLRVVILCGAGRDFSSGADLSEFLTLRRDPAATEAYNFHVRAAVAALAALPVPVVAEIRGVCMGAGLALAAQADLRCLAEDARLAIPAARIGVAYDPDWVTRLVAASRAEWVGEMIYAGRAYGGAEAVAQGFAARALPEASLAGHVQALAADIARGAPLTMRATKLALAPAARTPEGAARARAAARACDDSDDYRRAIDALGRKEKVEFKGQ
ncbi:MAG: enoyl-CoA hydratase/isomerase family protein [Rhodobacter sp.]|uniref:enoyl-CoA hydratase-related protein n=1 Tax=Pararhodobacter sp. TaxID=2127056 RepID=UPI001D4C60A7|nr:enoyl-CoA hydratase-related protein [Pararhodobacter sp.]MCB1343887.1 enoyl-CoA hydratase/isomerase family protein [Paracoccaceae bacterium]MCC0074930.1 enoyl-CoA hydratase/isomerase family protein [Rhodobacter sp.]HPD91366.1 enoyl-CoA hydratase-related protein [Pararhodobacter sp.]